MLCIAAVIGIGNISSYDRCSKCGDDHKHRATTTAGVVTYPLFVFDTDLWRFVTLQCHSLNKCHMKCRNKYRSATYDFPIKTNTC